MEIAWISWKNSLGWENIMNSYDYKLLIDFFSNLIVVACFWILLAGGFITIFACFKLHSNNKLKSGAYILQYIGHATDPEIKKRILEYIDKKESQEINNENTDH